MGFKVFLKQSIFLPPHISLGKSSRSVDTFQPKIVQKGYAVPCFKCPCRISAQSFNGHIGFLYHFVGSDVFFGGEGGVLSRTLC